MDNSYTYKRFRWNSKAPLNNPNLTLSVNRQFIKFDKLFILPNRSTILTNNVSKQALENCYVPVNNQVNII